MEKNNSWRDLSDEALEEWFLNRLPESKAGFNQLLEVIAHFAEKDQLDKAGACADLLQETLKQNMAAEEFLLLLERRAGWQPDPEAYASACLKTLTDFFQGRNPMPMYLAACGLANGVQPQEALRRLRNLRRLQPGTCCYEKTWGLGIVSAIDEFDRKLLIDFENKRAHALAFSYAAESIQPLDDDHFLALKLRDPEKFHRRVMDNPAETVKTMLKQFGAMNLPRLRALMTGLVIPEKEWIPFWAAAREKLSADPLVQMPPARNDPIRILAEKKEFDDRWRSDFSTWRDVDRILSEIESLFSACPPQSLSGDLKKTVEDRLKFVVRGIGTEQQNAIVQALLFADSANIGPELLVDISVYAGPEVVLTALNSISARMIRPFLTYLEKNSLPITPALMQIMPRLSSSALNEAALYCRQSGKEEQLFEAMRVLLQEDAAGADMILWMGRNLRLVGEKNVCQPEVLAQAALLLLQRALAADKKKDAGQLMRQIFTDKDLLKEMLSPMEDNQRLDFSRRLHALAGLTAADKTAMAAKIILLFPNLANAFSEPATTIVQPKLTSYRSYRERQAQLEKIIKEEIPRNSKEIGLARSYGDLRENYEYKAAREMQSLLMRRKAELEKMLSEVQGADFADFRHDIAGPGTSVELKMPDGSGQIYHILGEWDSDEKKGIISCRSKLADALNGRRAGDSAEIPGENSALTCTIEKVSGLPPEIKTWISGT